MLTTFGAVLVLWIAAIAGPQGDYVDSFVSPDEDACRNAVAYAKANPDVPEGFKVLDCQPVSFPY